MAKRGRPRKLVVDHPMAINTPGGVVDLDADPIGGGEAMLDKAEEAHADAVAAEIEAALNVAEVEADPSEAVEAGVLPTVVSNSIDEMEAAFIAFVEAHLSPDNRRRSVAITNIKDAANAARKGLLYP